MTWTELLDQIMLRRTEFASPTPDPQNDVPFFIRDDCEKYLFEEACDMLRELRLDEIESLGEDAVQILTAAATNVAQPVEMIGLISAKVNEVSNVEVVPATYVASSVITSTLIYTIFGGQIFFTGANAEFTLLVTPTLSQWQANYPLIMPKGREEMLLARVLDTLWIIDTLR